MLNTLDSPESYDLALQCIRNCESQHPRCMPPVRVTLPSRVIDYASPAHPRLFITGEAPEDYYVALSYVWGEAQPNCKTANLSSNIEAIHTKYIPKTILDAIKVTHTLGLRYLWVDSFCILQDSKEDEAIEIANIRSIFRYAYKTVIAANARKVSDGFLRHILPDNTSSKLPFCCADGTIWIMYVQERRHAPSQPVDERAWCLEERVLSSRALWYCSHKI